MPLTVLPDSDIRSLLYSLRKEDVEFLGDNLAEAMHDYSTGTQETTSSCSKNQPSRIAIPGPDSALTLFMPATTGTSRGIKIVTLGGGVASSQSRVPSMSSLNLGSQHGSGRSDTPRSSSPAPQSPSVSSTASTGASAPSYESSVSSAPSANTSIASSDSTTPRGSLTLLTPAGMPYAFLGAEEMTAFRTALVSTFMIRKRHNVHSITVFGAGKQARWHIRLALLLRGSEIHHVDIVNKSFARAKGIMHDFYRAPEWEAIRLANPKLQFSIVSSEYGEYQRLLKEHVRKADVIFCCTPSTTPLFPHEFLTSTEGRKKGRYISAIGSYRSHMLELHPEILKQAVAQDHKHHHHRHAEEGGVIIVDSLTACMKEAGEVIQADIGPEQLVELGELMMVKKAAMREIAMGTSQGEKGLSHWLTKGNVIYKGVGIGLMDICVGEDIVQLARERGIGTHVDRF